MTLTRRAILFGSAAALIFSEALAARRKRPATKKTAKNVSKKAAPVALPPKLTGTPLAIPPLVEPKPGETWDLAAGPVTHEFRPGKPAEVSGFGGRHLGPTIRLRRGETTTARLVNGLARATNIHFHGLLVDSAADGALATVAAGASWQSELKIEQSAATLWYHAHMHGSVGRDVQDGLAGMLIVEEPADRAADLPSSYGVDDFPLILQDKIFDAAGKPLYDPTPDVIDHGFRGDTIVVNGTVEPLLKVPQRPVRLRLLNAANARVFRVYMEDERSFSLIATDGGYLPAPASIDTLMLAPGERAEIIVDFADGSTALMSTPDDHEHRMGAQVMKVVDSFVKPIRIIAFEAVKDGLPRKDVPGTLPAPLAPKLPDEPRRRRFVLDMPAPTPDAGTADPHAGHVMPGKPAAPDPHAGHVMPMKPAAPDPHAGHVMPGAPTAPTGKGDKIAKPPALPGLAINGKGFAMGRIDETIAFGTTEIWEIVAPQMPHPFHIHGAQFRVLSEDGATPRAWNRGPKDTVFVETNAEILVTFNRHADATTPFLYHCHVLEHEDAGMMGTFTVT